MEFVSTLSRWSKNLFSTFLVFSFHKKKKNLSNFLPVIRQLISSSMHVESKITYPQFIILESFFPLPLNEPDTLPSSFPIHRETSMTNVTRLSSLSFE